MFVSFQSRENPHCWKNKAFDIKYFHSGLKYIIFSKEKKKSKFDLLANELQKT